MTTRNTINSNFYQLVNVDANGTPTSIKTEFVPNITVAGSNTQVQFNNAGNLGASANLTFDNTTNTLSATSIIGSGTGITNILANNITGTVANATYAVSAGTAGTVTTNAQPNITSVGILNSLNSVGNITAPFFIGNVVGNISGNLVVPGTNTSVLYNQLGSAGASDAFKFDYAANVLTVIGNISATNFSGSGAALTSINGANVSEVANASYATNAGHAGVADSANAVAGGNVSGAVGLATYATTANAVAGANVSGAVGLATYATTANAVAGANVSGAVGLATYATTANAVAGANVSGAVGLATYATTANAVAGANVSGEVANAGYATNSGHAGVADSANSVAAGNISGTINFATYAGTANAVAGANVSGEVATANYASYAGNVTIAAQGNITSLGNLTGLTIKNGNVVNPIINVTPAGNTVGIASSPIGLINVTDYGSQSSNAQPFNLFNTIKARGNVNSPLPAANNDQTLRLSSTVYTGNGYPRAAGITMSAPLAANSLYTGANVTWTPGVVNITTGNPFGNVLSNASTTSAYNVYQFNQNGRFFIGQGAGAAPGHNIAITSYGSMANGGGVGGTTIIFRGRGNGDAGGNLLLENGDTLGGTYFMAMSANGTANISTSASIIATVDTTYGSITPNNPVPSKITLQTSDGSYSSRNFVLGGDGNITLPLDTSSINYANGSPYGGGGTATALNSDPANVIISGGSSGQVLSTDGSGNLSWAAGVTPGGSDQQVQFNNGGAFAGTSNLTYDGSTLTSTSLMVNNPSASYGTLGLENSQLIFHNDSTPGGVSPMNFYAYANTDYIEPMQNFTRMRGNIATPVNCVVDDYLGSWRWQAMAGGVVSDVVRLIPQINNIDGSNISASVEFGGATDIANCSLILNFGAGVTINSDVRANNFILTKYNETVVSPGSVSGTLTPNAAAGTIYHYTLTGGITINALGNAVAGTSMTLILTQDGSGSHTLTSSMKFAGGAKTLSTAASSVDIMSVFYDGSTYYATLSKGYA